MAAVNPFVPIYKACNSGTPKDKIANLPEFPRLLDIELTNCCNFRCRMCPVGQNTMKRVRGFMSGETYSRILAEANEHKTPLRFIRWGEPLIHPQCFHFARAAKKLGLLVHINTNGLYVDDEAVADILRYIDSIKFSFQGVNKRQYFQWRKVDFFEELLGIVKTLYRRRGNGTRPFIQIGTTVTEDVSAEQRQEFIERVKGFCDKVEIGRTRDLTRDTNILPTCPEMFDKLSVNWDGTVTACCSDYDNELLVGNIWESTLSNIWLFSPALQYLRKTLAEGNKDDLPRICQRCSFTNCKGRTGKRKGS